MNFESKLNNILANSKKTTIGFIKDMTRIQLPHHAITTQKSGFFTKGLAMFLIIGFMFSMNTPLTAQTKVEHHKQTELSAIDSLESNVSVKEIIKNKTQQERYENEHSTRRAYNLIFYVVYVYYKIIGSLPSR